MPAIQLSLNPQDGPMQFISSGIPPATQAQPASSTDVCLQTEDLWKDQGDGWGVPNAIAVEL